MRESPRTRRLRNDYRTLENLRGESTILDFETPGVVPGELPEIYALRFSGTGLWRPAGSREVLRRDQHEVYVRLGANYPRMMPELAWKSPVFHPNISSSGFVCLGGYGSFWAPSLHLDELCVMLWDMVRYQNFDINSPYNREAAAWVRTQDHFSLPVDARPLRNRLAGVLSASFQPEPPPIVRPSPPGQPEILFLDEVVDAEVVSDEAPTLLVID